MDEVSVKEYLMVHSDRFRTLVATHQDYEQRLKNYVERPFLTSAEQVEETVLKKKKLALKDQMQFLIHERQTQQSVPGR